MSKTSKNIIMDGITALQWAREISKLPDGEFTLVFFPYSRARGEASAKLQVRRHCKYRTQLPKERFASMERTIFSIQTKMESQRCATGFSSGTWASLRTDLNFTK